MLSRNWNGRTIRQREDGYICLTDMAQAVGKRVNNWLQLDSSKSYLDALSSDTGIPVSQIIEVKKGNSSDFEQGTWGQQLAALEFARWCSPELSIQCNKWVLELLLTGKVDIREQPKQLTSFDRANAVNQLAASLQFMDMEIANPRFKQGVQDLIADMLGLTQPSLPGTSEIWLGVAERAEQLGYAVSLVTKHRSQLGKWVKLSGLDCKVEKRLCGGTQRPVNLYLQCNELDVCIQEFLDAKILAS